MKNQTAVEWLMEQITYEMGGGRYASYIESVNLQEFFEKAKEMEMEQIVEAYIEINKRIDDIVETVYEQYHTKKQGCENE
jgi:hypothetical protein